jgi:hypothetical protein
LYRFAPPNFLLCLVDVRATYQRVTLAFEEWDLRILNSLDFLIFVYVVDQTKYLVLIDSSLTFEKDP